MKECSKSIQRRLHNPLYTSRFFVGAGIDIGGRPDPLSLYRSLFCRMESCRTWDLEDGDAQFMEGVPSQSLDFVHSSHCLEHMADPAIALSNWLRILKPGGHAVILVPDEDMYEQGIWPSRFNRDHKWTFAVNKTKSWSPVSLNILDLVSKVSSTAQLVRLERLEATWRPLDAVFDQTLTPVGECGIEFVLRKNGGKTEVDLPDDETRLHLNQYLADQTTLRKANLASPPFRDASALPGRNS